MPKDAVETTSNSGFTMDESEDTGADVALDETLPQNGNGVETPAAEPEEWSDDDAALADTILKSEGHDPRELAFKLGKAFEAQDAQEERLAMLERRLGAIESGQSPSNTPPVDPELQRLEKEANEAFTAIGAVDFSDPDQAARAGKLFQEAILKVTPYLARTTYAQVSEKETIAQQLRRIRKAGATPDEIRRIEQFMANPDLEELYESLKLRAQLKTRNPRTVDEVPILRANRRGVTRAAGKRPLSSIAGVGRQPATLPKLPQKYEQANRLLGIHLKPPHG